MTWAQIENRKQAKFEAQIKRGVQAKREARQSKQDQAKQIIQALACNCEACRVATAIQFDPSEIAAAFNYAIAKDLYQAQANTWNWLVEIRETINPIDLAELTDFQAWLIKQGTKRELTANGTFNLVNAI